MGGEKLCVNRKDVLLKAINARLNLFCKIRGVFDCFVFKILEKAPAMKLSLIIVD